jgi:hypothetical protein
VAGNGNWQSGFFFLFFLNFYFNILKISPCQSLVAHACNSSYSGGTDQENHSSKPAWANSL